MKHIFTLSIILVALSVCAKIPLRAQKYIMHRFRLDTEEATLIITESQKNAEIKDVGLATILAVIERESAFNKKCKSYSGCLGLMQVNYKVWKSELKIPNTDILYNIKENIKVGTEILSRYILKYGLRKGLGLYYGKSEKAKSYSKSVVRIRKRYKDLCFIPEVKKIRIIGGTDE